MSGIVTAMTYNDVLSDFAITVFFFLMISVCSKYDHHDMIPLNKWNEVAFVAHMMPHEALHTL